jgi:hypothetical protein
MTGRSHQLTWTLLAYSQPVGVFQLLTKNLLNARDRVVDRVLGADASVKDARDR